MPYIDLQSALGASISGGCSLRRLSLDLKWRLDLLPVNDNIRRGGRQHLETVTQPLLMLGRLRLDFDPQRVEFWVVVKMPPQPWHPIEDDSPFGFGRNGEKGVRARRQLLAFDKRVVTECDVSRLVGSGAPETVVWHELAPDLPFVDLWSAVCDRDLQRSDLLTDFAAWAGPGRHGQSS